MSEREWIVVRDQYTFYVLTEKQADELARKGHTPRPVGMFKSRKYADGFADALNYATQYRSVLPEWEG